MDGLIHFLTQPLMIGGFVAPFAIILISSIARWARGVQLSVFADVIGLILCLDIAVVAAPDELKGLISSQASGRDLALQHLGLLVFGLVCWLTVLLVLEPLVLNEPRGEQGVRFLRSRPTSGARTWAWIGSVLIAWFLVWLHLKIWWITR